MILPELIMTSTNAPHKKAATHHNSPARREVNAKAETQATNE